MKYFDANAMIRVYFGPREGEFFTADDLLEEMIFFEIDETLFYQGLAKEYDLTIGNRQLMIDIAKAPRLHPCWLVGFQYGGMMSPPKRFLKSAIGNNIQGMRLFFGSRLSHSMVLDMVSHQELFEDPALNWQRSRKEKGMIPLFCDWLIHRIRI